jgi:hypothetical protein
MQNKKAYERSHHGHTGTTRHSPHNGFNRLLRALPGDQGFVDTVTGGIGVSSPTGPTSPPAGLTPTSRRQDHTTWHVRVTRRSSKAHPRPPHPAPRIVTIASRPLGRNGTVHRIIRNQDAVKSDSAIQKIILPRRGEAEPGSRCINSHIVPGQKASTAGLFSHRQTFFRLSPVGCRFAAQNLQK